MKRKISILGAGSYGTALASSFARMPENEIYLWARNSKICNEINSSNTNKTYFKSHLLSKNIYAESNLQAFLKKAQILLYACPSSFLQEFLEKEYAPFLKKNESIKKKKLAWINCSKGINSKNLKLHHQNAEKILGNEFIQSSYFCLSGPSFSEEIMANQPTSVTLASLNSTLLKKIQQSLSHPSFRIYTSKDIIGCEIGGAAKNVIAIATGMAEGMGFGYNTQAALINRGLYEISRLGRALGARPETFLGLSGMGDLVLTCTGKLSRNRQLGYLLGRGSTLKKAMKQVACTIEGIETSGAIHQLSQKMQIDLPICFEVYQGIYGQKPVNQIFKDLLNRPYSAEWP